MVLLLSVEFLEEVGGVEDIFIDGGGSRGFLTSRCGGVVRWVGVLGHFLSVIDAEGVLAKGGVGVLMFKGLGLFLTLVVLVFLRWGCGRFEQVIVQVLGGWW